MYEFKVKSLPNDLKMLAFSSGELINAAYYFVTYANVMQDNCRDVNKVFSLEDDDADWKPFSFKKRIEDSISVEKKKVELLKKSKCGKVNRTTITNYIGKTLHSRQEFPPLLGKYIDYAT